MPIWGRRPARNGKRVFPPCSSLMHSLMPSSAPIWIGVMMMMMMASQDEQDADIIGLGVFGRS